MTAVQGIRIKTSDLVAYIADDAELSDEISNVMGTDGIEHIEAAVQLLRDLDKLTLTALGVVNLLDGVFEVSPDGSMTFYDPDELERAIEVLESAYAEIGKSERPVCASLGITDHHAVTDVGDIHGLALGLMSYHEEVVLDELIIGAMTEVPDRQAGDDGDDAGDDGDEDWSLPTPAPTGEVEGFAKITAIRTGSAGVAADLEIAREDGSAHSLTFHGEKATLVVEAIRAMDGQYATFKARVGHPGQGQDFWIALGDSGTTKFMDH